MISRFVVSHAVLLELLKILFAISTSLDLHIINLSGMTCWLLSIIFLVGIIYQTWVCDLPWQKESYVAFWTSSDFTISIFYKHFWSFWYHNEGYSLKTGWVIPVLVTQVAGQPFRENRLLSFLLRVPSFIFATGVLSWPISTKACTNVFW